MDLTLFELHLEDATLNAPFADRRKSDDETSEVGDSDAESGRDGGSLVGLVVGVSVLLALGALIRRRRNGGETPDVETDEIAIEEA